MRAKRKPKRRLGRSPRPVRRLGTEVMADRRTNRLRDRGADEREQIDRELREVEDHIRRTLEDFDDDG